MRTTYLSCLLGWSLAVLGCGADDSASSVVGGGFPSAGGTPGGAGTAAAGGAGATGQSSGSSSASGPSTRSGCATKVINAYGLVPDVLIVLDRSLSMLQGLRWDPSKQAVKTITSEFEGLIAFGLEYFPGGDANLGNLGGLLGAGDIAGLLGGGAMGAAGAGGVPLQCGGMEKIDVPLMLKNAMPIASSVDATFPNGFTPTGPALTVARQSLGDRSQQLDVVVKPAYVLLVTDGDPRCGVEDDPTQQDAARAAVKALKAANIPTYVFGYQIEATYQGLMNELAMLGGTRQYFAVENSQQIIDAFRQITKDVINCTFSLDEVPPDLKKVRIQIDGVSVPLGAADGWVIDGTNVTLQGGACAKLKDGKGHTLAAQIECTDVVLL